MGNKFKYYVVWEGLAPGIYDSWEECQLQVKNYKGAKYKSFPTKDAAIKAFRAGYDEHLGILGQLADVMKKSHTVNLDAVPEYLKDSLAVDASCLGIPVSWNIVELVSVPGKKFFGKVLLKMGLIMWGSF